MGAFAALMSTNTVVEVVDWQCVVRVKPFAVELGRLIEQWVHLWRHDVSLRSFAIFSHGSDKGPLVSRRPYNALIVWSTAL